MKRLLGVLVAVLVLAAPAVAHPRRAVPPINVKAAWRLDQRFEQHRGDQPVRVIDCKRGPYGNVGCDYLVYFDDQAGGSNGNVIVSANLSGVWEGHDAIVRRHHKLVVLMGKWLHWVAS